MIYTLQNERAECIRIYEAEQSLRDNSKSGDLDIMCDGVGYWVWVRCENETKESIDIKFQNESLRWKNIWIEWQ